MTTTLDIHPSGAFLFYFQAVGHGRGRTLNVSIVVEARTNLADLGWQPLQTNLLTTGLAYFSDLQWTNFTQRLYRVRSQ